MGKPQQHVDVNQIDQRLQSLNMEGETPEERVIDFKKQFWVDETLSKNYLEDLSKEYGKDKEAIMQGKESAVLAAINHRKTGEDYSTLSPEVIKEDKRAYWVDSKITDSVVKKIDQVEKAVKAMDLNGDGKVSTLEVQNLATAAGAPITPASTAQSPTHQR